jgi:hypothetical protein
VAQRIRRFLKEGTHRRELMIFQDFPELTQLSNVSKAKARSGRFSCECSERLTCSPRASPLEQSNAPSRPDSRSSGVRHGLVARIAVLPAGAEEWYSGAASSRRIHFVLLRRFRALPILWWQVYFRASPVKVPAVVRAIIYFTYHPSRLFAGFLSGLAYSSYLIVLCVEQVCPRGVKFCP